VTEGTADTVEASTGESVAPVPYSLEVATGPLDPDELALTDAWWRAANYLAVGQIYLRDNPLTEPLAAEHVKPRLDVLGHSGRSPG
jgi:xylulose-5-phosphate/fructose-6-phosphate phosphoketolase